MADLRLVQDPQSLKWDFQRTGSDLERSVSPMPSVLRLLVQGSWIGDDGERSGNALPDLRISTSRTTAEIQRIVDTRLGVLLRSNAIVAARVTKVVSTGDRAHVEIEITEPGQPPQTIQVPLKA